MSLRIYLLGQFYLRTDDQTIELPSRPAQSLLAYLALNAGMAHRREKLSGIFWPEATEANARANLRQALWRIRKALGSASLDWEQYLHISDISITFDTQSRVWLDARLFQDTTTELSCAELLTAAELYKGELLPGFYGEWVFQERDRIHAAYHQRMNRLLELLLENNQWREAIKWSEHWIQLGHSPEPAFRVLMCAYSGLGDQAMINATYERCVEVLDRDIGVEVSTETQRLYEYLRMKALPRVPSSPAARASNFRQPFFLERQEARQVKKSLFVARDRELARLDSLLDRSLDGQGRVIFVTGEAGSGKTALIQEFAHYAQDKHKDLIIVGGDCNAHTGIGDPYLPFREILELLTGDVEARWAAGAITHEHALRLWNMLPLTCTALVNAGPDLVSTFIPAAALAGRVAASSISEADWAIRLNTLIERKAVDPDFRSPQQSDLFHQYTKVLQTIAREAPLLLIVDDLQWADLGSISLLFQLGRNLAGCRILVVGAFRPEEIAIGRSNERHPLTPVISEFQRQFGAIAVDLDRAERRDFIEAVLNSEPNRLDDSFGEMLYRQTRGHPLFTIELLRGLQERGDLVTDEEGYWIEGMALNWDELPARVEAVVSERIGRLAPELQAVLRVASVEGEVFTAEVIAHMRDTDENKMMEQLSVELDRRHQLIRAQQITRRNEQTFSSYRFRHIQIQKYLYGSLDEVERAHLHKRVGCLLEELYGGDCAEVAVQLARHFEKAEMKEKAVQYLYLAGNRAHHLSANEEAITHLLNGLALLATLPDSHERAQQELDLQLTLGVSLMSSTIPDIEMETAYARARDLCQQLGKTSQLSNAIGGLVILNYVWGRYLKARAFAEEALSLARQAQDPLLILLGHWYLGFIHFCLGEYLTAREHLAVVNAEYDPERHHTPLVVLRGVDLGPSALAYDACCLWCLGYPDQAMKHAREALALARKLNHDFTLADALCYAGCMLDSLRREPESLEHHAEELIQMANEKGIPGWMKMAAYFRGEALFTLGHEDQGIAIISTSIADKVSSKEQINYAGTVCFLAEAYLKTAHIEMAQTLVNKAFSWMDQSEERHRESDLHRVRAELRMAQGDDSGAQESFEQAIRVAQGQYAKSWELRVTIGLARLLQKQNRIGEAQQRLAAIYNWFEEGFDTPDLIEARELLRELSRSGATTSSG